MGQETTTAGFFAVLDEEQALTISELLRKRGSNLEDAVRFFDLDLIDDCRNALIATTGGDQKTVDALKKLCEMVLGEKRQAISVGDLGYLDERRRWVVSADTSGKLVRTFEDLRIEADSAMARDDKELAASIAHHLELLAESAREAADPETFVSNYTGTHSGPVDAPNTPHRQIADLLSCTVDEVREIFTADASRSLGAAVFPAHLESIWSRFFNLWHSALMSDDELRPEEIEAVRLTRALRGAILAIERDALREVKARYWRGHRPGPCRSARQPWASRRVACRPRSSRGKAARTRGSRRSTSNSRGGGDPPDGDSDGPGENPRRAVRSSVVVAISLVLCVFGNGGAAAESVDPGRQRLMVETLDPHSPEWWRPAAEKHQAEREKMRLVEAELEARGIDADGIREALSDGIGWFDPDSVEACIDPEDYCGEFDARLWEAAIDAVRRAGFNVDDPTIFEFVWDDFYEVKQDNQDWAGFHLHKDHRWEREIREVEFPHRAFTTGPFIYGRSRARQSRGRAVRPRGSRRVTSRSAGGGSSGDDDSGGDPEPPARGKRASDLPGGLSMRSGRVSERAPLRLHRSRPRCSFSSCRNQFFAWIAKLELSLAGAPSTGGSVYEDQFFSAVTQRPKGGGRR